VPVAEVMEMVPAKQQPQSMLTMPSPMQAVELVKERYAAIRKIKEDLMHPGIHYGHVGLTGDPKKDKDKKPALFQPGAQVLAAVFGLEPEETLEACIERWDDPQEVFLYYRFKFNMRANGKVVGTGQGSCNSKEVKYRYRDSKRKCPDCGAEAIQKSKYPDRNTGQLEWYCYDKIGGCKAKFDESDPAIVNQVIGKRINPDIGELANPILKMAHKRGFIAAVLMATMASEFFAQDPEFDPDLKGKKGAVEESEVEPPWEVHEPEPPKQPEKSNDPKELRTILDEAMKGQKEFLRIMTMFRVNIQKSTKNATGTLDDSVYFNTLRDYQIHDAKGFERLDDAGKDKLIRDLYARSLKLTADLNHQMETANA
jgi:predicted RNA-binding Zn-ribbon protein involved in translation (DUF1610 family)